ncbi:hypothetical protein POVWA2_019870 [Plasmodium ovale wallikeri]|uniref:Uncharacterized protein n=1 Tax=Plasmodium ovale wallikeri TaxID=864142 RepID=A0A1A8YS31_PLAOA|nr:hypothetical protein POVWA1_019680 [Plasmodium ovale wallikeri]SBT34448.1 hypothetical protein POVWA2_019870 [Plasmodium ovale wallikeri]
MCCHVLPCAAICWHTPLLVEKKVPRFFTTALSRGEHHLRTKTCAMVLRLFLIFWTFSWSKTTVPAAPF